MSDVIDDGCEREQQDRELSIEHVRRLAADIPVGAPGECETCGAWSGRLVNGMCCPCRDRYKQP